MSVQLTEQSVARYKGGRVEIRNHDEQDYFEYRGEVEDIRIENNEILRIKPTRLERNAGFPWGVPKWIEDERLVGYEYVENLSELCSASRIGSSDDDRLFLDECNVGKVGKIVVLYPPKT